jgi:hypothetical protein
VGHDDLARRWPRRRHEPSRRPRGRPPKRHRTKEIEERLAAGWIQEGLFWRPPRDESADKSKPERKRITDDPEWQRRNKAQREERPLEPDQ